MARTVSSLIAGRAREDAPGGSAGRPEPGPARRDRRGGGPGRRHDLRRGVRRGPERAARLGPRPGARARARDPAARPPGRGQRRDAGADHDPRDRQADRGGPGFGPGGRRHVQLLRVGGTAALRDDRPVRAPGQAAVHVPQPGRRRGDRHGGELPGRGPVLVPGPGAPVRERGRVEARRVRARDLGGARPVVPARRLPRRGVQHGARRRGLDVRRALAGARRGIGRQGRVHGFERGGAAARRALRAPPADAVSGARRQEPARRDARRRPRARGRGRAVQRVRHGGAAVHIARAR